MPSQKRKVWFIHGRPGPHPLHKKYGESIGSEMLFVDPVLRWHDKNIFSVLRYLYWVVNAFWIAVKVKKNEVLLTEGVHITALLAKKIACFFGKTVHTAVLMDDEFLYFLSSGFYKGISAKYNRYFVTQYDHFFCIGDMEYRLCCEIIKDDRKISKGFNGVSAKRMGELLLLHPQLNTHNIIFIGNGPSGWRAHYKGFDLLLEVFNELCGQYNDSLLFIIGNWDAQFIQSYIQKYCPNYVDRVVAVGRTNDLGRYLSQCNIYLHPGRGEAWGISISEAMCAGVVPLVSKWTGAAESVQKIAEGLVLPLEKEAFTNAITKFWGLNFEQKKQLSDKAKQVAHFYTEAAAINRFNELFFDWEMKIDLSSSNERQMKKLLFYYPSNKKTNSIKAQINLLLKLGFEVFVLTQEPEGAFHKDVKTNKEIKIFGGQPNIEASGINFYWHHARYLVSFCKTNNISIVFSHLQVANLVSLIASARLPAVQFYFFRHHFQYFKKFRLPYLRPNKNELIGEKLISLFARNIIVPSNSVREGMIKYENVSGRKVTMIPYIYDFDEYPKPNLEKVQAIRNAYPFNLRLLMCSRFIEGKRHTVVFEVIKKLIQEQALDIGLLLLDNGPLRPKLQQWVQENKLEKNIFFLGYVDNIMDYYASSDLLVHPSLTEASNSSVKEMAMVERTAAVCTGVGDFDDYIEDKYNGFLMDPINTERALITVLQHAYINKAELYDMGRRLKIKVVTKFTASDNIVAQYKSLLKHT